jgi:hypothetical protein
MAKQYRVKPSFLEFAGIHKKVYVIQEKGIWRWHTISNIIDTLEEAEKDCEEAQKLYDKYDA